MNKKIRTISITALLLITAALYLWPDFHPERVVVNDHRWYYDLIIHGGYFLVATFLLLLLRQPNRPVVTGLSFFAFSVVLEFLQYFSYNRSVDIVDVASNLAGIVVALTAYKLTMGNK